MANPPGGLPCEKVGDARREIWIKPPRVINSRVARHHLIRKR